MWEGEGGESGTTRATFLDGVYECTCVCVGGVHAPDNSHACSTLLCMEATGHIKDPVPLIEKRRGLSPGGRFPPSFIHQVIIITGLKKLQLYVLALKMALDADRA